MKSYFYASVGVSCLIALFTAGLAFVPLHSSSEATSFANVATLPVSADAPPVPKVASMLFFGDIMLGRNVEALTNKHGDDYPFALIDELIQKADFVVANLEGPIVHDHSQTPTGSFVFSFKDLSGALLKEHGFDLVSLANNHTLNQGNDGFTETESNLDAAQVLHVGHPIDASDARIVHTIINTIPVIFVGFNETFVYDDPDAAVATIKKLASASSEPIIALMHWGNEYQLHSDATQESLAHELIDAGADLIIGGHPHVVEEIESYKNKFIFYSLGNFIFDQYFSTDTQQELSVAIDLSADGGVTATLHPLQSVLSQPALMNDVDTVKFLQALADRSDPTLADEIKQGVVTISPPQN